MTASMIHDVQRRNVKFLLRYVQLNDHPAIEATSEHAVQASGGILTSCQY
jgi:hypothetical protein